jgi:hypothetical protein
VDEASRLHVPSFLSHCFSGCRSAIAPNAPCAH